jgi:hypothetical protein
VFKNPTVFILGAGASWHYGYPTGEELVKMVVDRADAAERYFSDLLRLWSNSWVRDALPSYITEPVFRGENNFAEWRKRLSDAANDAGKLATRLRQVNPLVIDYFLGQNPSLQSIGTLIIAWIILECEATYIKNMGNINRRKLRQNSPITSDRDIICVDLAKYKDDWYRFIIHKLVMNCSESADLLKNNVRFVTFNYDVSLESLLYKGLCSIELFYTSDIEKFLSHNRVMHIYGNIRDDFSSEPPPLNWDLPLK